MKGYTFKRNHPAVAQTRFGPNGEVLPYDIGEFPIPNAFAALPFQVGGEGNPFGDDGNVQVCGGVNNVFDEYPPVAPLDFVNNIATNGTLYDVVGRYLFAGVRVRF